MFFDSKRRKNYVCKLDWAFEIIRGKWKVVILCHLLELQRITCGVSPKVLNEKLKELEDCELIYKKVYDELPLNVEYHLTLKGKEYTIALKQIEALVEKYYYY